MGPIIVNFLALLFANRFDAQHSLCYGGDRQDCIHYFLFVKHSRYWSIHRYDPDPSFLEFLRVWLLFPFGLTKGDHCDSVTRPTIPLSIRFTSGLASSRIDLSWWSSLSSCLEQIFSKLEAYSNCVTRCHRRPRTRKWIVIFHYDDGCRRAPIVAGDECTNVVLYVF